MNKVQYLGPNHPKYITPTMEDALCLQKQIDELITITKYMGKTIDALQKQVVELTLSTEALTRENIT